MIMFKFVGTCEDFRVHNPTFMGICMMRDEGKIGGKMV